MSELPSFNPFGNGLLTPFRRAAGLDFVSGSGEDLVVSAIKQILKTSPGQLRWRPSFGGALDRFKNRAANDTLETEIEAQVFGAIANYETRVRIHRVRVVRDDTTIRVQLTWSLVPPNAHANSAALQGPTTTEVVI